MLKNQFLTLYSVSGSSATIYAYLGEFHNDRHRSRAIMWASVIFGVTTVTMPLLAWWVINRSWSIYVPFLDIHFKPWRLFIIVCGLPSLIGGIGLWPMPESPKYIHSVGQLDEAIAVLQTVYRLNSSFRRNSTFLLPIFSIVFEQNELQQKRKADDTDDNNRRKNGCFAFFTSMWIQTVPLFRNGLLRVTVLASLLQFGLFSSSSGVYMWLPEVVNRMTKFIEHNPPGTDRLFCDIIAGSRPMTTILRNESAVCKQKTILF